MEVTRGKRVVDSVGQYDGGDLYQQTRGDSVSLPVSSCQTSSGLVTGTGDVTEGNIHPRGGQHSGRQFVQGVSMSSNGLVAISDSGGRGVSAALGAIPGPVRVIQQSAPASVLLEDVRCAGADAGCVRAGLDRDGGLRVSTNIADTASVTQDSARTMRRDLDCALLDEASVVSGNTRFGRGRTVNITGEPTPITDAGVTGEVSRGRETSPDCLAAVRRKYQKKGFSAEVAKVMAGGRRSSTNRVYSARLKFYFEWCRWQEVSPTKASIAKIAEFLKFKFDEGLQAGTVRGYLSAIQAIHDGIEGVPSLLTCRSLKLLIDGMYNLRPPVRKIWPAWDLPTVLKYLEAAPFEPMGSATVRDAALKTSFLLAIASGRRCSEIHACAVGGYTVFSQAGVTLYFKKGFLAKNERINFRGEIGVYSEAR